VIEAPRGPSSGIEATSELARVIEMQLNVAEGKRFRAIRIRRSRGRGTMSGPSCASPLEGSAGHWAGRDRWVVTLEDLFELRDVRVYVCVPCVDELRKTVAARGAVAPAAEPRREDGVGIVGWMAAAMPRQNHGRQAAD